MEYLPCARSFGYYSHWSLPFHLPRKYLSASFITFACRMPESHTQLPICSSPHTVTFVKAFLWLHHNPASKILLLSPQTNAVFNSWFCMCNPLWQVCSYLPCLPRQTHIHLSAPTQLFLPLQSFPNTHTLKFLMELITPSLCHLCISHSTHAAQYSYNEIIQISLHAVEATVKSIKLWSQMTWALFWFIKAKRPRTS